MSITTRSQWKRQVVEPGRDDGGIRAFLDEYARAVTSGDGRRIAAMWTVPALVVGDTEALAVNSMDEIERFFDGAKAQYAARGIVDTRPDALEVSWLSARLAMADVRWPYIDAAGEEIGDEASTYILRQAEDGRLLLQAVIMRGESPG